MTSPQTKTINEDNPNVFSYRRLRRAIGFLGFGLPFVLMLLSAIPFFQTDVQPSISHFYYTNLRDIFSGTLCAIGLFLIRYKGFGNGQWWKNDNLLTNICGATAFGVALIPTDPLHCGLRAYTLIPYQWDFLGGLHYFFAGTLFLSFSLLSICAFTIGQKNESDIPKSTLDENNIYKSCGYSIIFFIAMVPISSSLHLFENSTLVFETLSLITFGISWLIKGRALGQSGNIGKKIYRENN